MNDLDGFHEWWDEQTRDEPPSVERGIMRVVAEGAWKASAERQFALAQEPRSDGAELAVPNSPTP